MRIRLSVVCPDVLGRVRIEVEDLRNAVIVGDMDGVDAATVKLAALTADSPSVNLTEEQWRVFLNEIRKQKPEFESDYLLPGEICSEILPTAAANDYVLELPIDEEPGKEEPHV